MFMDGGQLVETLQAQWEISCTHGYIITLLRTRARLVEYENSDLQHLVGPIVHATYDLAILDLDKAALEHRVRLAARSRSLKIACRRALCCVVFAALGTLLGRFGR